MCKTKPSCNSAVYACLPAELGDGQDCLHSMAKPSGKWANIVLDGANGDFIQATSAVQSCVLSRNICKADPSQGSDAGRVSVCRAVKCARAERALRDRGQGQASHTQAACRQAQPAQKRCSPRW